jgi:extradiol dioxygenase family protein
MRDRTDAFHLAIPTRDLSEAEQFYVAGLGCHLARRYDDRITLDFFGDQVVCHLSEQWDRDPSSLYPRHFGISFRSKADFDNLAVLARKRGLTFYQPLQSRFDGRAEQHLTFVLQDPSNNLIEFKHYHDPRMMY